MTETISASVVGGSGFTGGELLRLLADHPVFELREVTSREYQRRTIGHVHPNLRDVGLRFTSPTDLDPVDVVFTATPHGVSMRNIDYYRETAGTVVDLSADFRLNNQSQYDRWYEGHTAPEHLTEAVYALPELHREDLPGADLIATGGCNATATLLALQPLVTDRLLETSDRVVVDLKVGSSEGGAGGGKASSHAERTGVVRPYAPTGHRHQAEIKQELGIETAFTVHAVEMVRGAAATCHAFPTREPVTSDLWDAFRGMYAEEPFVDVVAGKGGVYRYPEPKAVAGTNLAEVGFALDEEGDRIVAFAAIDNMMKGAAGQAVHAANIALGLDETAGLDHRGLHPVGAA